MLSPEILIDRYLDVVVARALSERDRSGAGSTHLRTSSRRVVVNVGGVEAASRSESAPKFSQSDGDGSVGDNGQASLEARVPFAPAETRTVRSHPSRLPVIAPHPDPLDPPDPERLS